jgi:hypothetical protein
MSANTGLRPSLAIVVFAAAAVAAFEASPDVTKAAPSRPAASAVGAAAIRQVTGVTIVPSAPEPDEPIHVRIEGNGTCKVWLGLKRLDADSSGLPPVRWNPLGGINDVTRAPDATLALPGELPAINLGAGHWKIGVDSHEGFPSGNCKGGATLEFQVARKAPSVLARQGAAPADPQAGAASSGPAAKGQAPAAGSRISAAFHQITGVTILPAAPQPDEPIRVRIEGNGTCKVWLGITWLDGSGNPLPNGWNPVGLLNEMSRAPDAKLALPGELPAITLRAGRWRIVVDSHEGIKGSTCTGGANIAFQVAAKAPTLIHVAHRP